MKFSLQLSDIKCNKKSERLRPIKRRRERGEGNRDKPLPSS